MNITPPFTALLPAAGSGKRFGTTDKLLTDLAGQSVLQRAVALFASRPDVAQILLVTSPDRFSTYKQHLQPVLHQKPLLLTPGGSERWESVLFGLRAVTTPFVAIHDAARPLTPQPLITAAFTAALNTGGSVPCLPEPATLKRAGPNNLVSETVPRANLFQAQTPQCFKTADLLAAYETLLAQNRLADVTDDAQVFERTSRPVQITPGSPLNLKITTPEDTTLARALLS